MNDTILTGQRTTVRWACVLIPFVVAGGLGLLRHGMAPSTAAIVLVLTVVGAAATADRLAGILAALSAAAGFDFFLTAPYFTFAIRDRDDIELALALAAVGVAVSELAMWGQRQRIAALRRLGHLEGLATLLDADPADLGRTERSVAQAITRVLGVDRAEFVSGQPRWNDAVVDSTGAVSLGGRSLDVGLRGLPTEGWTAIPIRRDGTARGHIRLTAASRIVRPNRDDLRMAVLLAHQWPMSSPRSQPIPPLPQDPSTTR